MATYYWVGGAGTWSTTSTTNWASTSGGAGGAGVPTSADDVVFDANSDTGAAFSVTINTGTPGAVCNDLTFTAPDVVITITGIARILDVYGDITLSATNVTFSSTLYLRIAGGVTQNLTSNGRALNPGRFDIINSSTIVLQDAASFGSSADVRVIQGTLDTNNNNLTIERELLSTGDLTRSIIFGSSTVTLSESNAECLTFSGSNFTFNAGTSTINITDTGTTFNGGGFTFYDVNYTSTANDVGTVTITGANTFNNLSFAGPASSLKVKILSFRANQTINGTFSFSSTAKDRRVRCISSNGTNQPGTQRTLTCNAVSGFSDIDFMDIVIAGSAAPASGTRLGNAGNNGGITFDAPKTVYWNLGGTTRNWLTDDGWATTSGGSPSSANFPLVQDTCVIDDNSTMPTTRLNMGSDSNLYLFYLPAFDCSSRTTACVIDFDTFGRYTGNFTLSNDPDITYETTSAAVIIFELTTGKNATITTNGVLLSSNISSINIRASATSTLTLGGDIEFSSYSGGSAITLDGGTLDLNEYKFYSRTWNSNLSGGSSYAVDFGTAGEIICKSSDTVTNSCFEVRTAANFTYSGNPTVRYQGTKTSGQVRIQASDGTNFTATNVVDFFVETGSGFTIVASNGVRDFSSQGYTGTSSVGSLRVFGSCTIGSGHTPASTTSTFIYLPYDYGSGAQTFTTNGRILNCPLDIIPQGATSGLTLNGNLTLGNASNTGELLLGGTGTFDLNDYNVTCWFFDGDGATAAVLNMGSGTFELTGTGTIWDTNPSTGITINAETSTILCSNTTNTAMVLSFGTSTTLHNFTIAGGSSAATVDLLYTTDLTLTGTFLSTRSGAAYEIEFQNGATLKCADFVMSGSAGNLVLLSRTGTSPTTWSIEKTGGGIIDQVDYCDIEFSNASPGSTWYAGANSVDGGSNTGWIFTAPPPPPAVTATGNFFQLFFP